MVKNIASACGSPSTKNLGKYLGAPLIHGRICNQTYSEIVDKTLKRLVSWKSSMLSFAGRVTLIKAVTSSLLVYAMQSIKLPGEICGKLDKLNRNFLWGHTEAKKTVHLVNWDTVCCPKSKGGLGLKNMKLLNQALFAKAGWRIMQGEEGLWGNILLNKYIKNSSLLEASRLPRGCCSSTWRGIIYGASLVQKGTQWRVGDGTKIHFWTDSWISGIDKLEEHAIIPLENVNLEERVCDYLINGE
ncbi:hypothetical protein ACOSP7_028674 [Xanthoceras sorbifolium]